MKLSFTTLGCPNWNLDTIIARAVEYGFDGVDFRGYLGQMNIYELPEFSDRAEETRKRFADANLEISCFSSSVSLFSRENLEKNLYEVQQYARLCSLFNTRFIRVFGGGIGDSDRSQAIEVIVDHLKRMDPIAKSHNIKIILETHDDWLASDHVRAVMEKVDREAFGVLWDIHHPYRMLGEQPEKTWEELGNWIEYTHWKDSRIKTEGHDGFQYCLAGEGDIPFEQIYSVMTKNNYNGWFTLEWEKKWHPEIEEPEVAFPGYVQYMRNLDTKIKG